MKTRPSRRQTSPRAAPLGIPPIFLLDALRRDRSASSGRDMAVRALLREYFDAKGTSYPWGHVIEADVPPFRTWRIVPVALWERDARNGAGVPQDIPDRLARLAPQVRTLIGSRLPRAVRLSGLQAQGRRHRFALFTLMRTDPGDARRVRRWISQRLLPELLPRLLAQCELQLRLQRCAGPETRLDRRAFGARGRDISPRP